MRGRIGSQLDLRKVGDGSYATPFARGAWEMYCELKRLYSETAAPIWVKIDEAVTED